MPPGDKHNYEARKQQIIDAALQVFSQKGFEKATNFDIARAAGIRSPGLIYHYFKSKGDLFREVLQQRATVLELLSHPEDLMDRPPRAVLTLFATRLLNSLEHGVSIPMMKIMLSEAVRRPAIAEIFNRIGPGRGIAFLTRYLAYQMDLGRLRRMDPGIAVRSFVGSLLAYIILREVFIQPDSKDITIEAMVAGAVDIFLCGMEIGESNEC